jgi:Txe/YoeB family toxin of Txe-Axe toxin-antitoxin module
MCRIIFAEKAWEDYLFWQKTDKKTLKRINTLLKNESIEILQCKGHYDE